MKKVEDAVFQFPINVELTFDVDDNNNLVIGVRAELLLPPSNGVSPPVYAPLSLMIPLPALKDPVRFRKFIDETKEGFSRTLWPYVAQMIGAQVVSNLNLAAVKLGLQPASQLKRVRQANADAVFDMMGRLLGVRKGPPEKIRPEQLERKVKRAAREEWKATRKSHLNLPNVAKRLGIPLNTLKSDMRRKGVSWRAIKGQITADEGA